MSSTTAPHPWNVLLRATSRSFYLSLRCVPARRREALSLGYLLARAADTLSDAGDLAAAERLAALRTLRAALRGTPCAALPLVSGLDAAHAELLRRAPEALERIAGLPRAQENATRRVLERLLRGMQRELEELLTRGVVRRETPLQTMCWAYRAAGCVGAYWDELIEAEHPSRDARERRTRRRAAVRLGLGLQEVNLLRDAHEDHHRGRRLLAGLALDGSTPEAERAWFARARADLCAGFAYAASIRSLARRDRLAIALPARLGSRTLELLERERTAWLAGARLKVSRRSVRQELGRAALDALFPSRLARTAGSTTRGGA